MDKESTKYLDFIFVRIETKIREKIAQEIEAVDVTSENALGMQIIAAKIARGQFNG
jgi:hypothetical protein